ncbi:MAG: hypothetical protein Unbinned3528contig1000_20 [Prokaryotic dsDNA virus sp.]|nr:MAG: hypothetical protein Unbinned3528contig1000_20 [Prokaryotic dsDNA virus sp.]|tara:strand:- start:7175 stop:7828 length:654 start_codon:yes stop_codon:yes gene_type:complete
MRIKINIPESLQDITLGQYQDYLEAQETIDDDYQLGSRMIEIFCNIPVKDVFQFRMSHITNIQKTLIKIFENKTETLINRFTVHDIEFGFIPSLDEMTFGEYVDIDTYIKDWKQMHKAMAVLYRPIDTKYDDRYSILNYDGKETDIMKDMPLAVCFSSIVFFYNLGIELSQIMMGYMELMTPTQRQQLEALQVSGGGISQFSHSLKVMLEDLKISLD